MHVDFTSLNPQQRAAVFHADGPLLVLAGAGSGKTRVITYRIARLLCEGVAPEKIIGMTFTNKAAKEMRQRLRLLVGQAGTKVHLSTFHSLGLSILREEYEAAGLRQGFCVYDMSDQQSLVRDLMRQVKVADRRLDVPKVLDIILRTKKNRQQEVVLDYADDYELAAYDLYPKYVAQMQAFNAVDFDDLMLRAQDVLQIDSIQKRWGTRYDHVLVDEYQDTSQEQLNLVRILVGTPQNVCVVGDDDQSIYGWRGAVADNILKFGRHFKGATEVMLEQNYRSTGNILSLANEVISANIKRKDKRLWSAGDAGESVAIVSCDCGDGEATFVAQEIHQLLYAGVRADDIAVLYRANAQSRIFEQTLSAEHIEYRVLGGQAFFDRKEVRDAVAYLAVCVNPTNEVALRRIINAPPRGIGLTSIQRLTQYAEAEGIGLWSALKLAQQVPDLPKAARCGIETLVATLSMASKKLRSAQPGQASVAARELFDELKLRDSILSADDPTHITARRLENLEEVCHALARSEKSNNAGEDLINDFLAKTSLDRHDEGRKDDTDGQVTLMTLHSAKGLEFQYVFLVGAEEELLPHRKTLEMGGTLEEERRLCYVGITRARRQLWITWAKERMRYGHLEPRGVSRFVENIDSDAVVKRGQDALNDPQDNDKMANDFFAKMRAKLDITDE